jgi:hypothetical protein
LSLKIRFTQAASAVFVLGLCAAAAQATQVDIMVDKISQHMRVLVDGRQQYDWLVSTGGQGYDTPSGTYHIFRMEKDHFSKEWDDAPMPYSMFFTGIGHAIHGSYHVKALGTRASHGCVRLAPENAAVLWDIITKAGFKNNTVVIKGGFFDNGNLTTEQTFHMTPKDQALLASASAPKPLFWWAKRPETPPQKTLSLFDSKTKVKVKAKAVADIAKPTVDKKKKKKKLVPAAVGAQQEG